MTRLISTLYAHTILYLVLYVQVHILGGRLFRYQDQDYPPPSGNDLQAPVLVEGESTISDPDRTTSSTHTPSHIKVLTETFHHFFNYGVQALVNAVEQVVRAKLEDWTVVSQEGILGSITLHDFEKGVSTIRYSFEYSSQDLTSLNVEGLGLADSKHWQMYIVFLDRCLLSANYARSRIENSCLQLHHGDSCYHCLAN